jgi:hypothetical protein
MISRLLAKLGFFDVAKSQETKGSVSANFMGMSGNLQSTSRYEKPSLDIYDADAVAEVLYDHSPQFGTLIVIDEFDIISRKRDEESIHFNLPFLLRACSHLPDDKGVHFLIVGLAFSGDSVIEGHPSLARSMIDLRVSRIKRDDVRYFFEKGFELAGFSIDRATLDYLVMCSAGYPYTMHYLGDALCEVAEARSRRNISGDLVRIALPMSRQNYPRKNAISYRGRSLNEVETLLRMAYSWKDGVTAKDILSSSVSDQKISGVDEVISVLESLVKQGLLNRVSGTEVYYFVDPYTRVKVMLDRESKEIGKSRFYPSSGHDDLPLFTDDD